jgi:hypothetical protein
MLMQRFFHLTMIASLAICPMMLYAQLVIFEDDFSSGNLNNRNILSQAIGLLSMAKCVLPQMDPAYRPLPEHWTDIFLLATAGMNWAWLGELTFVILILITESDSILPQVHRIKSTFWSTLEDQWYCTLMLEPAPTLAQAIINITANLKRIVITIESILAAIQTTLKNSAILSTPSIQEPFATKPGGIACIPALIMS